MQVRYRGGTALDYGFVPIDYYNALHSGEAVIVPLESGEDFVLRRPGVGLFFHVEWLRSELEGEEIEVQDQIDVLHDLLTLSGVDVQELTVRDVLSVLTALFELTTRHGDLAWLVLGEPGEGKPRPVDYTGRPLAFVVHTLSYAYGWTLEEILELPPEVALAHVQEVLLARRRDREWTHFLSDRTWSYEKATGSSKYRPMSPLPWEVGVLKTPTPTPVPQWIKDRYYPKGEIIDLTRPDLHGRVGRDTSSTIVDEAPEHDPSVDPGAAGDGA